MLGDCFLRASTLGPIEKTIVLIAINGSSQYLWSVHVSQQHTTSNHSTSYGELTKLANQKVLLIVNNLETISRVQQLQ